MFSLKGVVLSVFLFVGVASAENEKVCMGLFDSAEKLLDSKAKFTKQDLAQLSELRGQMLSWPNNCAE